MNRDVFTHVALRTTRSGVFAGELLTVEIVALVGAITKRLVFRSPTPAEGIRRRSLDFAALVIEERHRPFHSVRTTIQHADLLCVRPVRHFLSR